MMPWQPSKGKIIVFGIMFWYPLAGVTYQFLHYLIGLRRLGYDPYYVEDSSRWVYDPDLNDLTGNAENNVKSVAPILESHGFADRWAFRGNYPGGACYGLDASQLTRLYRAADAFLNVTGAQEIREEHLQCSRRIYVETDPVVSQIRVDQGNKDVIDFLAAHDCHFSFGENLGASDCGLPISHFAWQPTRQPVVLDLWDQCSAAPGHRFTTIATWRNKGRDITYKGIDYYWSKDREFLKFLNLPRRCTASFELAMTVDDSVTAMLDEHGWRVVNSLSVSRNAARYRDYIQSSRGEFTVGKDQNVRLRSGWFSDRSACYLAAGRPVITQDTGFGNVLPTGKGLFSFVNLDDIVKAIEEIDSNYAGNCRAAKDIAAEYFRAETVLTSLLTRAGF